MKIALCVGATAFLLLLCGARPLHAQRDAHAKPAAVPECPEGTACTTFKQMWLGGDRTVKSATWACFDLPRQLAFGLLAPTNDSFYLLRDGVSSFDFHRFYNGTDNVSATAVAESFRNGVAHWKPDNSGTSLEVVKSKDELTLDLHYTSTTKASVGLHVEMRLSSGRYTSHESIEKKHFFSTEETTEDDTGQCVLLPKAEPSQW